MLPDKNSDKKKEEESLVSGVLGFAIMPGYTLIGIVLAFIIFASPFVLVYYLFFR